MTTISFTVNNTSIFRDRYPELRTGAFTRNIVLDNTSYTIKITPNFFIEGVEVSILDEVGNIIISNLPFVESSYTNYLIGSVEFNNYTMTYNFVKKQFEINEKVS